MLLLFGGGCSWRFNCIRHSKFQSNTSRALTIFEVVQKRGHGIFIRKRGIILSECLIQLPSLAYWLGLQWLTSMLSFIAVCKYNYSLLIKKDIYHYIIFKIFYALICISPTKLIGHLGHRNNFVIGRFPSGFNIFHTEKCNHRDDIC